MKLNKSEGYELLLKILNHWSINESDDFQNLDHFLDNYINDCAKIVYTAALKWELGSGWQQAKDFSYSEAIKREHEDFLKEYDRDDECPDLELIAQEILRITKDIIQPFVDIKMTPKKVEMEFEYKVQKKWFYDCPNCKRRIENCYEGETKCRYCKSILLIENNNLERDV